MCSMQKESRRDVTKWWSTMHPCSFDALRREAQVLLGQLSTLPRAEWERWLRVPGDVYVQSPNVHEVRAYNRLARLANASLLVFLQGDNCMPPLASIAPRMSFCESVGVMPLDRLP